MANLLNNFYFEKKGPLGVARVCRGCGHSEFLATGIRGAGRAYGMVYGNKARGRIIQHVKTCSQVTKLIEGDV